MDQEQLSISFAEHPSFSREMKKFNKKYDGGIGYSSLKRLLDKHFHPTNKATVLTPKVLRRVDNIGTNIEIYKVTMAVKGLSQGQSPRVCFRHAGNLIVFICVDSHTNNYKASEQREKIKARIKDLDPQIQFR
jgi:hypothetical protein